MNDYKWPWIKCSEALPEFIKTTEEETKNNWRCSMFKESVRCLVLLPNGNVTDSKFIFWKDSGSTHWQMLSTAPTHWMPYPDGSGADL